MPERDRFPAEYFDGNPFEGESPEGAYRKLRWGNEPKETFEIEGPEDMATIGELARLDFEGEVVEFDEENAPFLAVGVESNRLYIVPKDEQGPIDVPEGEYTEIGAISQIDYYSDKGGEDAYYYHEHEEPYPKVYQHKTSGVLIVEPEELDDGSRSYAVGEEGVIG